MENPFIIKAGTIIFASTVVIWLLSNFNAQFQMVDIEDSMLAAIGSFIAPVFAPLGFGDWQSSVATITGLVAKENVVATMGVLHGIADATEESVALLSSVAASFTVVSAFSFMAFNLLCAPCFAAIGAIKREMGSAKMDMGGNRLSDIACICSRLHHFPAWKRTCSRAPFGVGAVIAIVLIALIVWLMARKGSDPCEKKGRTLSAVEANY